MNHFSCIYHPEQKLEQTYLFLWIWSTDHIFLLSQGALDEIGGVETHVQP